MNQRMQKTMRNRHTNLLVLSLWELEGVMAAQQRNRESLREVELRPRDNDTEIERLNSLDPDDIARRAYERFEARGGEHGRDQQDWFEAEREARSDSDE
jgi:hypothetical protein